MFTAKSFLYWQVYMVFPTALVSTQLSVTMWESCSMRELMSGTIHFHCHHHHSPSSLIITQHHHTSLSFIITYYSSSSSSLIIITHRHHHHSSSSSLIIMTYHYPSWSILMIIIYSFIYYMTVLFILEYIAWSFVCSDKVPSSSEYQGSLRIPVCQNGGSFPKLRDPNI